MPKYLKFLSDWNRWGKTQIDAGIKREGYLDQLKTLTALEEIVGICGVRRCGKTTLLLQLIERLHHDQQVPLVNMLYINFEDPRLGNSLSALELFSILEEYKLEIKPKGKIYLFLDEIQVVEDWEKFVRTIYDQQQNVKIFVTGSNSSVFNRSLSTLLSGRMVIFQVYPLDFSEFVEFKSNKGDFDKLLREYLTFGGFPKVVLEPDEVSKRKLLISYYSSILEQDVILKNGIKKQTTLKQLAKFVLSNISKQTSSYSLSKILKIANQHVSRYLEFLEDAYLIHRVPKFAYSVKKQIYNPDKIYCVDLGLVNTAGFAFSDNFGRLLENLVYQKLRRQDNELYYWQNGSEVDLLIKSGIEVKKLINVTTTVDDASVWQREIKSLETASVEFPKAQTQLIYLNNQSNKQDSRLLSLEQFLAEAD